MKRITSALVFVGSAVAASLLGACGSPGATVRHFGTDGDGSFPARRGTVLVMGCALDEGQRATLSSDAAKRVIREVVLMCLAAGELGVVSPADAPGRTAALATAADVRGLGYRVQLGLVFGDAWSAPYDADHTGALLADPAVRAAVVSGLAPWVGGVDGLDVALWPLRTAARADGSSFVTELDIAYRPAIALAVQVPPSITTPSDLPDGEAFDVSTLSAHADRIRVTTLDYSSPDQPGPTVDPGWAVSAERLASGLDVGAALDVGLPLYGWDFARRAATSVTYGGAVASCDAHGVSPYRGPGGSPRCSFDDVDHHDVFFDDASSLTLDLAAWDTDTLPADVGVLYWGLGAEDPALWSAIAGGQR